MSTQSTPTAWNSFVKRFNLHWHVVFTHFPISFFMVSAGFMLLHVFTNTECFELAAFLSLVAGAAVMVPTTLTGWLTWKKKYKGGKTKLFQYKIYISIGMLALSILLIVFRFVLMNISHLAWHLTFGVGFILLFLSALTEGYYGGRLNHH
jgi:hypothetical protein